VISCNFGGLRAMDDNEGDGPVLPAFLDLKTGALYALCDWCRCYHKHGPPAGWRQAHCHGPSPYRETGYTMRLVGVMTPAMLASVGRLRRAAEARARLREVRRPAKT